MIAGTACKQFDNEFSKFTHHAHIQISMGWKRSRWVNKSCGVSCFIKHSLANAMYKIYLPGAGSGIAGRAGAVELKTNTKHVLAVVFYLPPRTTDAHIYGVCVSRVCQWVHHLSDSMPHKVLPIMFADLNDGLRLKRVSSGLVVRSTDQHVGSAHTHTHSHCNTEQPNIIETFLKHHICMYHRPCSTAVRHIGPRVETQAC